MYVKVKEENETGLVVIDTGDVGRRIKADFRGLLAQSAAAGMGGPKEESERGASLEVGRTSKELLSL